MSGEPTLAEKVARLSETPSETYQKKPARNQLTSAVEVSGDGASVEMKLADDSNAEGSALEALQRNGLDPNEWMVDGWRSSEWTMASGQLGVSVKYNFKRISGGGGELPDTDELMQFIDGWKPKAPRSLRRGANGTNLAIGDTQVGKLESDLATMLKVVDNSVEATLLTDPSEIQMSWLGDHIEGFVSQGGASAWRTPLPLTDQIRIIRRVMLHAVKRLAEEYAGPITVTAIPGNHGDAQRLMGKGVTTFTDNHDSEALVQVADICALHDDLKRIRFVVPKTDEVTVTTEIAGTVISSVHGNQWRPGKHFDWWSNQSFGGSPLGDAGILLAGHWHHTHIEASGRRFYVQVPSTETESTWWRHRSGEGGDPGALVLTVGGGTLHNVQIVRA